MLRSLIPWRDTSLFPRTDRFPMLSRMEGEMEELMGRLFGSDEWAVPARFVPRTNLSETETEFEVTVDLPGLKPEEVKVDLKDGHLWISGERKEEKEEEGKTFHRVERSYGEFRRMLTLPAAIDENKVVAKFENGVLKVRIPKTEEAKPKHIEVKV